MLDEIFKALSAVDETNTVLNLKIYTWEKCGVSFKVLYHTNQQIKIRALNHKILARGR